MVVWENVHGIVDLPGEWANELGTVDLRVEWANGHGIVLMVGTANGLWNYRKVSTKNVFFKRFHVLFVSTRNCIVENTALGYFLCFTEV